MRGKGGLEGEIVGRQMKYEGAREAEEDGGKSYPDSLSLINYNRKERPN